MSDFIDRMERKADAIADLMERETKEPNWYPEWDAWPKGRVPGCPSNIKPWYNPPATFRSGVDRVLIGINPGGNPLKPDGPEHLCRDPQWHRTTFNEWVCAKWLKDGREIRTHQENILGVFDALYGTDQGKQKLVDTPSTNACPLRTEKPEYIPEKVWCASEHWCLKLLEHVRPKTIICNGNSTSGKRPHRSPWAMMLAKQSDRGYELVQSDPKEVADRRNLKHAIVRGGKFDGAHIIGVPQGIRGSRCKLHRELRRLSELHQIP